MASFAPDVGGKSDIQVKADPRTQDPVRRENEGSWERPSGRGALDTREVLRLQRLVGNNAVAAALQREPAPAATVNNTGNEALPLADRYNQAIGANPVDWAAAATLLNGFSDADIKTRVAALDISKQQAMLAANPTWSARVRGALLGALFERACAASDWPTAVTMLQGLSDDDIRARLRNLSLDRTLALKDAAASNARLSGLIIVASTDFTNSTDTGNRYTSNALVLQSGVVITKEVHFIQVGTFTPATAFDALQQRLLSAVHSYLSGKYKLRVASPSGPPQAGDGDYPITVRVVSDPSASYPMTLHGGAHGRSAVTQSGGNIYARGQATESSVPDITLAHESGHMILGASDEYANASVAGRVVTNDHSLMGNFYTQGIAAAQIKARHFQFLVGLAATWFPGRTVSIVSN